MTSEKKSDKVIDGIASETTKKALRNIRERELSEEWNRLSTLMASTRVLASDKSRTTDDKERESIRSRMFGAIDEFHVLYARTEALLPVNRHTGRSAIEDPDDLELFSKLNNRLHVMDLKYTRYIDTIPEP